MRIPPPLGRPSEEDDDGSPEYPLAPAPPPVVDRPEPPAPPPVVEVDPLQEQRQFSLAELLWVVGGSAVLLGLLMPVSRLTPEIAAGVLGACTLAAMILLNAARPQRAVWQLAWYALMFVYLVLCLAAMLNQPPPE